MRRKAGRRWVLLVVGALIVSLSPTGALGQPLSPLQDVVDVVEEETYKVPTPELFGATGAPRTGQGVEVGRCTRRDGQDYGPSCSRLKFSIGPIFVQPGNNSTHPYVQSIEKPNYPGYMVRFEPDMVRADGTVPPAHEVHLHHATWLNLNYLPGQQTYGHGPFFASGEEKTVAEFPASYGMPVATTDLWFMVHMLHNATNRAEVLWINYYIDYVRISPAVGPAGQVFPGYDGRLGEMKRVRPFWLDVWKNGRRANYPVFNTFRGYGEPITDPVSLDLITQRDADGNRVLDENDDPVRNATTECTWPRDECASFDSWNTLDVGQGQPGNEKGTDHIVRGGSDGLAGTLVGIGGHLHPGGLRVEVDAVQCLRDDERVRPIFSGQDNNGRSTWAGNLRCPADTVEEAKRIFTSDAFYFTNNPASWDFRMTVNGLPFWKVNMYPDTMLRINAVHEASQANWFELMGIAVAYVHAARDNPGSFEDQFYGVDPFANDTLIVDDMYAEDQPDGTPGCRSTYKPEENDNVICTRGTPTLGETPGHGFHGSSPGQPWNVPEGPIVDTIDIAGFLYEPGDWSTAAVKGVPRVGVDDTITIRNLDMGQNVYHSATSCRYPCNGATTMDYPIPDAGYGTVDRIPPGVDIYDDFAVLDTGELGISPDFGPARGTLTHQFKPADHGMKPGEIYTYYCRVHPFMRGGFKVVE